MAIVIFTLRKRKLPINLFLGFLATCCGTVIVEIRLFYFILFCGPSNRSISKVTVSDFGMLFKQYLFDGYYHAVTQQRKIIIPIVGIGAVFCIVFMILKWTQHAQPAEKMNTNVKEYISECRTFWIIFGAIVISALMGGLHDSGLVSDYIKKFVPILTGFNWGRFWVLNRFFWYVAFAVCLKWLGQLPKMYYVAIGVGLLQMYVIATSSDIYNYASYTWKNELIRKPRAMEKADSYISYNEFYSTDLFSEIKKDLKYNNENVAAVGYHPAVLMYNGFHCIDGYLNAYQLSYMEKFRTLIAPELDQSEVWRDYYDSWGGRMYLYNDEASTTPTWGKVEKAILLNIDPRIMRETFALKYLLSRAPIKNIDKLGISLVKEYHNTGLYDIYVYVID